MAVDPSEICEIADRLQHGLSIPKDGEVCTRTVIGRAYSAVYLALREVLREQCGDPEYPVDHATLEAHLDKFEGAPIEEIATQFKELKKWRFLADYWPDDNGIDRQTVGFRLWDAKQIVKRRGELKKALASKPVPPTDRRMSRPRPKQGS